MTPKKDNTVAKTVPKLIASFESKTNSNIVVFKHKSKKRILLILFKV
jgi:hypothetical protein